MVAGGESAFQVGYSHRELLTLENALFGAAFDDGEAKSHRSRIRLFLTGVWVVWRACHGNAYPPRSEKTRDSNPVAVGTAVYLGFGPVTLHGIRKTVPPMQPHLN